MTGWQLTMRTNKKQTAAAREMFGPDAVAYSERSRRFIDTPKKSLAGKCSTCLRRDCEQPTSYTIAIDRGYISVRGQGHSWDDAWASARKWLAARHLRRSRGPRVRVVHQERQGATRPRE